MTHASGALKGHVALITGGNGGIGLGIARGLASAGADIAIWGRNEAKNQRAATQLASLGVRVHAERCDVSDEDDVERAFGATVTSLGKVDSVFANAGISGAAVRFTELSLAEWNHVHSINLTGAFLTLRAGARHLVDRGEGGALVAVSSIIAIKGAPRREAYASSKTALLALARTLAVELAKHRIRVNALLPGWTDTDMLNPSREHAAFERNTISRTPVRRWADPDELGPIAAHLADPTITFHTGDTVVVDGGYTIF